MYARRKADPLIAAVHATATIATGWYLLGPLPSVLFFLGFVVGFALWLLSPKLPHFAAIRWPYFLTLALFCVHKVEERQAGFFPALSKLTGVPIPQSIGPMGALLYMLAAAWLLAPWLIKRRHPLGGYLAWSFFASMGITELAHFVFPLFMGPRYGYFPGMVSVLALAPAAWWGMRRMRQAR